MVARFARKGETITLLDDREVALDTDMLVIADGERPIGLAGIMGGKGTSITDDVRDVMLEAAFFTSDAILGRARRVGLATDASQRFERGVDFNAARNAVERATALLLQICGGAAGPLQQARHEAFLPERKPVRLRRRQLQRLLGTELPDSDVTAAFDGLGLAPRMDEEGWTVTPPSWRFDITIEPDLIEEALRHVGYDRVPEKPATITQVFRPFAEGRPDERALLETTGGPGFPRGHLLRLHRSDAAGPPGGDAADPAGQSDCRRPRRHAPVVVARPAEGGPGESSPSAGARAAVRAGHRLPARPGRHP